MIAIKLYLSENTAMIMISMREEMCFTARWAITQRAIRSPAHISFVSAIVFPPTRQAVPGCFIGRCAALRFRSNPSGVQRAGNTPSTGLCFPDRWRRWLLLPARVDLPLHPLYAAVESGACGAKGGRHPRIVSMPSCRKTAYSYRNALCAQKSGGFGLRTRAGPD